MEPRFIYRLIHVANVLDEKGFGDEANQLDQVIKAQLEEISPTEFGTEIKDFLEKKKLEKIKEYEEGEQSISTEKEKSNVDWKELELSVEEINDRIEKLKNYVPSFVHYFNDSKEGGIIRSNFRQDLNRIEFDAYAIIEEITRMREYCGSYLKAE